MAAFGEEDSPEKDVLKDFLARAVEQAKVKPVDVHIKSCESYLQRCTKQLEEAKASVTNCEEEVAKTQARLARLKMEADLQPPEPRAPRRRRIGSLSELQQKFRPPHPVQGSEEAHENLRKRAAKRRVCPDHPPSHEQDLEVWMRQDFGTQVWGHDIRSGIVEVALRRGVIDAKNSRTVLSSHRFQCRKHGHYVRRDSRYGYRGLRVGEASGPPTTARYNQDSTSDDEPLVRPNVGRDVVPRRQDRCREDETVGSPCCSETFLDGLEEDLEVRDSEIVTQTDVAETHSVEIAPTQLDTQEGTLLQPSRRLVLIGSGGASQNRVNSLVETPVPGPEVFTMSGSDTESFGSVSSVEVFQQWRWWELETDGEEEGPTPILSVLRTQATRTGLESLDAVDLLEVWKVRPVLMQRVPRFVRSAYRAASRQALDIMSVGEERGDESLQMRGWKLFYPLSEDVLPPSSTWWVGFKEEVEDTEFHLFCSGQWDMMVEECLVSAVNSAFARSRFAAAGTAGTLSSSEPDALSTVVQLGEVSAGRQALEGAAAAPGNERTLSALKDPTKRPPTPRRGCSPMVSVSAVPMRNSIWTWTCFCRMCAQLVVGAAPGPLGMTADHVRVLLDNDADGAAFGARGNIVGKKQGACGNSPSHQMWQSHCSSEARWRCPGAWLW